MMVVQWVGRAGHDGKKVAVWRGDVYKLEGAGTGRNFKFLGDIIARFVGRGNWKVPIGKPVTKGVPIEEADHQY